MLVDGVVAGIGIGIRMGAIVDGVGLHHGFTFALACKAFARAIRGGSLASAALSGLEELLLAEDSTCCLGGVIGLCCLQRRGR